MAKFINFISFSMVSDLKPQGRRDFLLLSSTSTATVSLLLGDSKSDLLNQYLRRSQENKAKNDKERLDSYYKRNYGDYFSSLEGGLNNKKELSDAERGILEWLKRNR